jgi:hypothetical protein
MIAKLGANGWEADPDQVQRLRVDEGQIGFWQGWQFRSHLELNVPVAGPAVCTRFTSLVNFILRVQELELTQGALRLEVFTGAVTPSGTWTPVSAFGVNRMTGKTAQVTPYVSQVTLETGGQFTGGTAVDLLLVRAAAANNSAQNVGADTPERGLPAGVYYARISTITGGLVVNDPGQGKYSLLWEERP